MEHYRNIQIGRAMDIMHRNGIRQIKRKIEQTWNWKWRMHRTADMIRNKDNSVRNIREMYRMSEQGIACTEME
jgi:hypothetical protein